jgi:hypothetical protein
MEWTDEGIVLGVRRHGESSAIVELLTRSHGRHLGLVRGGSGKRMRPLLQPGNSVTAVWRARLDEHLGYYAVEGTRLRAANLLASSHATYGVTHLASLARLLPERDPHEDIYEMLDRTLDDFDDAGAAAAHLIRFELAMLAEIRWGGVTAGRRAVPRPAVAAAAIPARRRGRRERLVGPGPAGRLSVDGPVPAPPRAGAARAGPFRCARGVYQRRNQISGEGGGSVGLIRGLNCR